MRVVILGCGPAGLFAAHAATTHGHDVQIFSKARKSFMRGAQYLHRPIPGLSGSPFEVVYDLLGPVDGYREKVYGDMSDVLVSPETLVGPALAWDIREAYDKAWDLYKDLIVDWQFNGALPVDSVRADMTFSTVPLRTICQSPRQHEFRSTFIWSTDMIKPSAQFVYEDGGPVDNLVLCSGDPNDWWYRASRIHGWENTEYPHDHRPTPSQHYGVFEVEKPVDTTCDCYGNNSPDGVLRLGRYGTWTKGVLSDSAYYEAERMLMAWDNTLTRNRTFGYHAPEGLIR